MTRAREVVHLKIRNPGETGFVCLFCLFSKRVEEKSS